MVTNDLSQNDLDSVRDECKRRWKIEEFHRKVKQLTGIEKCQMPSRETPEKHIGCAMLVWAKLKNLAYQTGRNVYELWNSQFESLVSQLFQKPIISFA